LVIHGPTPAPQVRVAPLLKVGGVRLLKTGINVATERPQVVFDMQTPAASLRVSARDQIDAIEVRFVNAALDPDSVVVNQSFLVVGQRGLVPGQKVVLPGNRLRFSVAHELEGGFGEGRYEVRLVGSGRTPIKSASEGTLSLDGQINPGWPSGNDVGGGDFVFLITVMP
jgi:hypothetical protein